MHPRQHRYRSESDRWGRDGERTASRYSPEGSGRRHRTVDYERPSHHHRRSGYRRAGYSRRFQPSPSPSPPRETDIFIEAGRLAAEYLAATGKLSRDAVTGKWHMVDSGENNLSAVDGRALARSGSEKHARDAESGGRRYSDEYDSRDSDTFERGRRKFGPSGFAGSNMGKELGKSGSWNERGWSSWDRNVDGDHSSVDHYKQSLEKIGNAGSQKSYFDEYGSRASETFERGRRKFGSSGFSGSNMDKELGKSGSWNERGWSSWDRNVDGDYSSVGHYKQSLEKNGNAGSQKSYSDEYDSRTSETFERGRRKFGSSGFAGSNMDKELGKSGSWNERGWSSWDRNVDGDYSSVGHYKQSLEKNGNAGSQKSYSDEYDSRASETFERGRRKFGSSGFAGSNMDKELGKSGSWNERGWSSWDRNVDGDHSSVDHYKQSLEKNGNAGSQKSSPGEITIGGSASLLESDLEKYNPAEGTKSSFSKNKSLPLNVSVKLEIASDDTSGSIKEFGEMKTEKEDSLVGVYSGDLVAGNGIANVSTETWSSLSKGPDSIHDFMEEDAHLYDREHSKVPGVNNANDFSMDISTGKLDSATDDKVQMTECGKHPLDDDNVDRDSFKRHREWFPSMDAQFHVSKPDYRLTENLLPARQDPITSESTYADPTNDQKRWNISLIPIGHANSFENLKEKQLFPGSLTCDLNLLGTSEINKNNDVANPSFFNSVVRMGKEAPTVNFGLSMSSNLGLSNKNDKHGLNAKGIEIIDLEDEPAEEDQRFHESKRRIQDDYGLLTLAYSGDGVPHSSSVTTDLNSSQGNMSLPKEEILGIDESVDISLGKLPSGLPEFWKKPTQDYWKSF